jgi:tRNA threonylcarbamoyladenosine biosynthesis protein TsaE
VRFKFGADSLLPQPMSGTGRRNVHSGLSELALPRFARARSRTETHPQAAKRELLILLRLLVERGQRLYNRPQDSGLTGDAIMVLLEEHMLEFISRSVEQTQRLGARLGTLLQGGDIICLQGPLGSGKTSLTQGIGRGWGAQERLVSPSFVLIREYERAEDEQRLYHIDLYRISNAEEVWNLGVDDFLGGEYAVSVIEWAERAESLVPPEHLWVKLDFVEPADATRRHLWFSAHGRRHQALLREFRETAFGA